MASMFSDCRFPVLFGLVIPTGETLAWHILSVLAPGADAPPVDKLRLFSSLYIPVNVVVSLLYTCSASTLFVVGGV